MQQNHQEYVDCQYANDYKIHFLLGQGGQASVYLGTKNFKIYALKIYSRGFNKDEAFKREVEFLNHLKYPHLINLIQSTNEADIKFKGGKPQKRSMIVLELAEAEMFEFIQKQGKFSPEICRTLFKQLVSAIKFLDDQGITHRDLKPENILFDENFNLKVSDFGLSTFTEGYNKDNKLTSRVGTEGYKCPEIEQGRAYEGLHADFFAAGVILFVMYSGSPPFVSAGKLDRIYNLIKSGKFSQFWGLHEKRRPSGFYPDSFKRLLNAFFSYDPSKRPTFESLTDDDWLRGDTAMGNQLKEYMQQRYDKIAETDEVKRKIAQLRKDLLQGQMMQAESKSLSSEQSDRDNPVFVFIERVKAFNNMKIQELSQTERKINYYNKDIGFTLAFLKDFIEECAEKKQVFINGFCQQIQPVEFSMETFKDEFDLDFKFLLDQEQEQVLKIKGKLYRQGNDKIGIQWTKHQGNDFWLSAIINQMNLRLKVLI